MRRKNSRKIRIYLPFALLFVGFGIVELRLFHIQIMEHQKYARLSQKEQIRVIETSPDRGIIYDRKLDPLAINVASYSLYASPSRISHPEKTARRLSSILNMDKENILVDLRKDRNFVWIKRKLSFEIKEKIKKLNLNGMGFIEEKERFYPEKKLACHILGWVGVDSQGLAGVEYYYNKILEGEKGKILLKRDALGHAIPFTQSTLEESVPGKNLVLTIDSQIQSIVQNEISRTVREKGAKSGEAVFINPQTGEVLALVSAPGYDPNKYQNYSSFTRNNRAIQHIYEPGSTFKVITSATLLEEGLVELDDKIYCDASIQFGDHTITDWTDFNRKMNFVEIMYNSSDVGMIKAAQRMDKHTFYEYITKFGFGETTGIDLPGESKGIVKRPENWYLTDFPCISIGQGIAVTPLQMVTALSAAINGGLLMRPHVVNSILNQKGEVIRKFEPQVIRRVISRETSANLRETLGKVVEKGTGMRAEVKGYTIGGKTGTAQIPSPNGRGYIPGKYIASFMGFAPVGDPKIAGIVVIKDPAGAYYGGEVAAPVFGDILSRILPLLDVLPRGERWVKN